MVVVVVGGGSQEVSPCHILPVLVRERGCAYEGGGEGTDKKTYITRAGK